MTSFSIGVKRAVYVTPATTGALATIGGATGYTVLTGTPAVIAGVIAIGGFSLLVISGIGCTLWLVPKQTMAQLTGRVSRINRELSGEIFPLNDVSQSLEALFENTKKERDELKTQFAQSLIDLKNTKQELELFQQKLENTSLQLSETNHLLEEYKVKEKEHLEVILKLKEVMEKSIQAVEEGNIALQNRGKIEQSLEEGVTQFDKENNEFLENLKAAKILVEEVIDHTNRIESLDQSNKDLVVRSKEVRHQLDDVDDKILETSRQIKEDLENTQKLHAQIDKLIGLIVDAKSFEEMQLKMKKIQSILTTREQTSDV